MYLGNGSFPDEAYLANVNIQKERVKSIVLVDFESTKSYQLSMATVNGLFKEYNKKSKRTQDPLNDEDQTFLHLLVNGQDFGTLNSNEVSHHHMKNIQCFKECIRLIEKFHGEPINTDLLK